MAATYQQYEAQGLIVIHLWAENSSGSAPTQGELSSFAGQHGVMSYPNLSDPGWNFFDATLNSNFTPAHMLIGPGMQVIKNGYPSDAEIQQALSMVEPQ